MAGFWEWYSGAVAEPLLSVVFPPRCVGCGDFETHLCVRCRQALEDIGPGTCPRCGEPGPQALVLGRCSSCMGDEVTFAGARSAFVHAGPARQLVLGLKAGDQRILGRTMAHLAGPAFGALLALLPSPQDALVTWVPCHRAVQNRRGYNQAEVLARELVATIPGLPLAGLVRKRVKTREQKGLDRAGRRANLQGVFVLDEKAVSALEMRPRALVLVDDVLTTGATVREVSRVLTEGMGLPVYVFTFSRAVKGQVEDHD